MPGQIPDQRKVEVDGGQLVQRLLPGRPPGQPVNIRAAPISRVRAANQSVLLHHAQEMVLTRAPAARPEQAFGLVYSAQYDCCCLGLAMAITLHFAQDPTHQVSRLLIGGEESPAAVIVDPPAAILTPIRSFETRPPPP